MVTSFLHYDEIMDRRAADVRLFIFNLDHGLVYMGKNNGNPGLVCKKKTNHICNYFSLFTWNASSLHKIHLKHIAQLFLHM